MNDGGPWPIIVHFPHSEPRHHVAVMSPPAGRPNNHDAQSIGGVDDLVSFPNMMVASSVAVSFTFERGCDEGLLTPTIETALFLTTRLAVTPEVWEKINSMTIMNREMATEEICRKTCRSCMTHSGSGSGSGSGSNLDLDLDSDSDS